MNTCNGSYRFLFEGPPTKQALKGISTAIFICSAVFDEFLSINEFTFMHHEGMYLYSMFRWRFKIVADPTHPQTVVLCFKNVIRKPTGTFLACCSSFWVIGNLLIRQFITITQLFVCVYDQCPKANKQMQKNPTTYLFDWKYRSINNQKIVENFYVLFIICFWNINKNRKNLIDVTSFQIEILHCITCAKFAKKTSGFLSRRISISSLSLWLDCLQTSMIDSKKDSACAISASLSDFLRISLIRFIILSDKSTISASSILPDLLSRKKKSNQWK